MMRILLSVFIRASCQLSKSVITFNRNVNNQTHIQVCDILEVEEKDDQGNYLGMPSRVGHKKKQIVSFVKAKVWKKI